MKQNLTEKKVRFQLGRKGITKQIRAYFWRHPHSNAKQCCKDLYLDYKKYAQICYNIKSNIKQRLEGKKPNRSKRGCLGGLVHRVVWGTSEKLPRDVVEVILGEASKRCLGRGEKPPLGKWYVVANRNRMMRFANEFVDIRVYPKSGTCHVLERRCLDWYSVKVYFENALFETGLDLRVCEKLSYTLQSTQSRAFPVGGRVSPFNISYYKDSLGLTIKADGSHPEAIEIDESYPAWIKQEIASRERLSTQFLRFGEQLDLHLNVLQEIRDAVREWRDVGKKLQEERSQ